MTVYGDLETSTLTELPAGRSAIATHVVPAADKPHFLERAWARVKEEVGRGRQAYVVCPRIGDGPEADEDGYPDEDEYASAEPTAVDLSGGVPRSSPRRPAPAAVGARRGRDAGRGPAGRAAAGHPARPAAPGGEGPGHARVLRGRDRRPGRDHRDRGRRRRPERHRDGHHGRRAVRRVPAAPAARPGRPRPAPGLCLLVTEAPPASPSRERLDAVAATLDGFQLSRLDLEQRREGDVLGAAQAGRHSSLRLLQLLKDEDLIGQARTEATEVVAADPDLARHPALREAIDRTPRRPGRIPGQDLAARCALSLVGLRTYESGVLMALRAVADSRRVGVRLLAGFDRVGVWRRGTGRWTGISRSCCRRTCGSGCRLIIRCGW